MDETAQGVTLVGLCPLLIGYALISVVLLTVVFGIESWRRIECGSAHKNLSKLAAVTEASRRRSQN
jgi:hypothetical protein